MGCSMWRCQKWEEGFLQENYWKWQCGGTIAVVLHDTKAFIKEDNLEFDSTIVKVPTNSAICIRK